MCLFFVRYARPQFGVDLVLHPNLAIPYRCSGVSDGARSVAPAATSSEFPDGARQLFAAAYGWRASIARARRLACHPYAAANNRRAPSGNSKLVAAGTTDRAS